MPTQQTQWTAELARALPDDGNRYEVLDGELFVSPAPSRRHQVVVFELAVRLREYVHTHSLGTVYLSPADIEFSARRLLQPDIFVVPEPDASTVREWGDIHRLLLAVEVVSPGTTRTDHVDKRRVYQSEGVAEYWVANMDDCEIRRWRPGDERPEVVHDVLTWQPVVGLPAFTIDLPAFLTETLH